MDMQSIYAAIKQNTNAGNASRAFALVDSALQDCEQDAYLHYLKGNIYMKNSDWAKAMNCYLKAERLDASSPAGEKIAMLRSILDFYNKDMYNQ